MAQEKQQLKYEKKVAQKVQQRQCDTDDKIIWTVRCLEFSARYKLCFEQDHHTTA